MNETIDASRDALKPTAFDHTGERSSADADFGRRSGGHKPFIFGGELQKCVEMVWGHGQNVTIQVTF